MKALLAGAAILACLGSPVLMERAEIVNGISKFDATEIQVAVKAQIDALAVEDADGAFRMATLDRQASIGSSEKFLKLIKKHYLPLHQHVYAHYALPKVVNGETFQAVRLTDRDSHVWLAVFKMAPGRDARWKIDGCYLLETKGVAI
ncbi:hypothetical protein BH11PSE11_BH11PSE11_36840 [soil metagenome]